MAYKGNSVVDYLKSIGKDSSYANRKKLAAEYGISNYKGTSQQNTSLLNSLRNGSSTSKAPSTTKTSSNSSNTQSNYSPTYSNGKGLTGVSAATQSKLNNYESGYKTSDAVNQAYSYLQNIQNNKPGTFSSQYENQLNDVYNQIMNRDKFTYDLNADALYNQYKDSYMKLGQTAMQDTMGQAAALTGGYGNPYAATAGNQAYQNYLSQLNDIVPDLYEQALNQYNSEGNDLLNKYNLANQAYQNDYSMYRDKVSDYQNDYNNAYNAYINERDFDYNDYANMLSYYQQKALEEQDQHNWQTEYDENVRQYNANMAYQKERDAVSDSQWAQQLAYQKEKDAIADSQWAQQLAYQKERDAIADSQWAQELALSQLEKSNKSDSSNSSNKSTAGKNTLANVKLADIDKTVRNKCMEFTDNEDLANYLDGQTKVGNISEEEADYLYEYFYQDMLAVQKDIMNNKSNFSYSLQNLFK